MNIKYLAYNFLKSDYSKISEFVSKLSTQKKVSKVSIFKDMIVCLFKYNTRFLDYFYFKFFDKNVNRSTHTNVWDMHLFHKKYNGENAVILRDKILFRERFQKYFNYPYSIIKNNEDIANTISWIRKNKFNSIVAKEPLGTVGKGVQVLTINYKDQELFIDQEKAELTLEKLFKIGFTLYESFIEQHQTLKQIYPKSINTIRIVSFVNNNKEVEIWGALLRMGYDKSVDNFDAGGLSAKIDLETGIVITPAIIKDPFNNIEFDNHPITNFPILNIKIPFWDEVINMVKSASLELDDVRTVGWDVAITKTGPTLIEGNDNWDKTHFELVSRIGINKKIKSLI